MTRRRRALPVARLAAGALLAMVLWAAPGDARAEPEQTLIQVLTPLGAAVGDVVELKALLFARASGPIAGARIVLFESASFMDTRPREVVVGTATTSDRGVAVIHYVAQREGTRALTVRFEGDIRHAPASVAAELSVGPGPQTHIETAPGGIPGVNSLLLVVVLIGVWGTMLIVSLHVAALAGGAEAEDAAEGVPRPRGARTHPCSPGPSSTAAATRRCCRRSPRGRQSCRRSAPSAAVRSATARFAPWSHS